MTVTISVNVNGQYKATVKTTREDGTSLGETVIGPYETKVLPHYHGEVMTYTVLEETVSQPGSGVDQGTSAPEAQPATDGEPHADEGKPEGEGA